MSPHFEISVSRTCIDGRARSLPPPPCSSSSSSSGLCCLAFFSIWLGERGLLPISCGSTHPVLSTGSSKDGIQDNDGDTNPRRAATRKGTSQQPRTFSNMSPALPCLSGDSNCDGDRDRAAVDVECCCSRLGGLASRCVCACALRNITTKQLSCRARAAVAQLFNSPFQDRCSGSTRSCLTHSHCGGLCCRRSSPWSPPS